jgi:hypothetical protein
MSRTDHSPPPAPPTSRPGLFIKLGVVIIIVGGILLMFGGDQFGTVAGTILGLAGAGLLFWGLASGKRPQEKHKTYVHRKH